MTWSSALRGAVSTVAGKNGKYERGYGSLALIRSKVAVSSMVGKIGPGGRGTIVLSTLGSPLRAAVVSGMVGKVGPGGRGTTLCSQHWALHCVGQSAAGRQERSGREEEGLRCSQQLRTPLCRAVS